MGYALAVGLAARLDFEITVVEPDPKQRERFGNERIQTKACVDSDLKDAEVVVFAIKPQIIQSVVEQAAPLLGNPLIISIPAGTPLQSLVSWLPTGTSVVRCMPNTPALIGVGITGLLANEHVQEREKSLAEEILGAVDQTTWFNSDAELDVVTAISGRGPAYFFYVIDALIDAGVANGLERNVATQLVVQTANGAAKMSAISDESPSQLRANVTSPGGTTERAIEVLNCKQVQPAFMLAVSEAYKRAQELAL